MHTLTRSTVRRDARELYSADEWVEQGRIRAEEAMDFSEQMYKARGNEEQWNTERAIAEARRKLAVEELVYLDYWWNPNDPSYNQNVASSIKNGYSDWKFAASIWRKITLKYWLHSVTEFTMDDLPFLLSRDNPLLNYVHKKPLVDEFYKKNPGAPRAKNIMGSTYLYAADLDCQHKPDPNSWSGVRCIGCDGWFCL